MTMKKISKILSNLFLIFTVLVLIGCIYLVVQSKRTKEEVYIFGYKPYIIQTGSMEPTLKVNSLIIVKKGGLEKIKDYDIISFKAPGFETNVCHRVIEIKNEGLITKGDNNNNPDEGIVAEENYVGKVVFNTNITSYLIASFETPAKALKLIIPIIAFIAIIIIIKVLAKNKYKGKRIKNKKEEKDV